MSRFEVRAFRRDDREPLTALVNAHVQAVVPGMSVSVNRVLRQLEREPGEFIVDPWVVERVTLVAVQHERVVAAAHVLRYGAHAAVGESYRGAGEIRWLVCWPQAPFWPDADAAGDAVAAAAVAFLTRSGVSRLYADGALPAPGVYGLPEQWPHIHAILGRAGFTTGDRTELVFLADVDALGRPPAPIAGLTLARTLGVNGTRLTALLDGDALGYIEVETRITDAGQVVRTDGWADVGNFCVVEAQRRRRIASWLLGQAAEWLRLGHIDRLLDYAPPEQEAYLAFLRHAGFRELTRTTRGWERATSS
ncbi:MAG: N-acetyltransferase [Pseudonocardiales bacterium]|nr:MAG: N-acetyltransferase [Pseudonocardiales bacterium]